MQNLNKVEVSFKPQRMVHIVGSAAETLPKVGDKVSGVTVQRATAGDMRVMAPADLGVYNKVAAGRIVQRQVMPLAVSFARCRLALEVMFEGIDAQQAMGGVECLQTTGAPCSAVLCCVCVYAALQHAVRAVACSCARVRTRVRNVWLSKGYSSCGDDSHRLDSHRLVYGSGGLRRVAGCGCHRL